jgi:hypothetical protein
MSKVATTKPKTVKCTWTIVEDLDYAYPSCDVGKTIPLEDFNADYKYCHFCGNPITLDE